ncbi:acyltransferase [Akkermansiaceae bacterium]|nr:acyltransferase [Akkermansiaceae bacterium]
MKARFTSWLNNGQAELHVSCKLQVPLRCDGKGKVTLGEDVKIGYSLGSMSGDGEVLLQARRPEAVINIGASTATNNNVFIVANNSVEIGEECLIGEQVTIYDSDFHALKREDRKDSMGTSAPVRIHDGVWLGSRVMVLKGVEIGENAVIAAGSVVTSSIPSNVIAGGIPARVIRSID